MPNKKSYMNKEIEKITKKQQPTNLQKPKFNPKFKR